MPKTKDTRPRVEVTEDEAKQIQRAASHVWQNIAYDVCALEPKKGIPRAEAIEVTVDAGRMVTDAKLPKELYEKVVNMPDAQLSDLLEPVFPKSIKRYVP